MGLAFADILLILLLLSIFGFIVFRILKKRAKNREETIETDELISQKEILIDSVNRKLDTNSKLVEKLDKENELLESEFNG